MLRRIAADNVLLLLQYAVASLVPLALVPHIVRAIGVQSFGALAVAAAWGGYGAVVVQYAFQLTGPARLAALDAGETPSSVFAEVTSARIILLLFVLLAIVIGGAAVLGRSGDAVQSWILMIGLPFAAGVNAAWFLQAQRRFFTAAAAAIAGSCVTLAVGFGAVDAVDSRSGKFAALALVSGPLITASITLVATVALLPSNSLRVARLKPRKAIIEGWPLFASQLVSAMYLLAGPIMISRLADLGSAGAYAAVERFMNGIAGACLLTHVAAYPRLAVLYRNDRLRYWRLLRTVVGIYVVVTVSFAWAAWLVRSPLQHFVFGYSSDGLERLLLWSSAFLVVSVFGPALTGYLTVSGRSRRVLQLNVAVLIVSVSAGIPGVLYFGAAAWFAALVLGQSVLLGAFMFYCAPGKRWLVSPWN